MWNASYDPDELQPRQEYRIESDDVDVVLMKQRIGH